MMIDDLLCAVSVYEHYIIAISILIFCDMLSGLVKACIEEKVQSGKFRTGLLKKLLDYIILIVGVTLDLTFKTDYLGQACAIAVICMEGLSILENCKDYVPIPDALKKFLENNGGDK